MRVIFLEDVTNLANAGEVRSVADGYARNYLFPKKLAVMATAEDMKRIERIKKAGDNRRMRETQRWEELANYLEGTNINVKARATPAGNFYGAITPTQIAQELSQVIGRDIDRRLVEALEPIREPGEYEVALHLTNSIQATIIVTAEAEE